MEKDLSLRISFDDPVDPLDNIVAVVVTVAYIVAFTLAKASEIRKT